MKIGDLVRMKHFLNELGVVVEVLEDGSIHVQSLAGPLWVHRNPEAFEVLNASR